MVTNVLGDFTIFVDGFGKWGTCETLKLPVLEAKTEEFRGGGMDTPRTIVLGTEKLETEFTLTSHDAQVVKLWGLAPGAQKDFTIRGSLIVPGEEEKPVITNLSGQIMKLDNGDWKPGEKAELQVMIGDIVFYRHRIDGQEVHRLDVINQVRIINGVDQLSTRRRNLGR